MRPPRNAELVYVDVHLRFGPTFRPMPGRLGRFPPKSKSNLPTRSVKPPAEPQLALLEVIGRPYSTAFVCSDCTHAFTPAKSFAPLRRFLNYGQDENEELVRRI